MIYYAILVSMKPIVGIRFKDLYIVLIHCDTLMFLTQHLSLLLPHYMHYIRIKLYGNYIIRYILDTR